MGRLHRHGGRQRPLLGRRGNDLEHVLWLDTRLDGQVGDLTGHQVRIDVLSEPCKCGLRRILQLGLKGGGGDSGCARQCDDGVYPRAGLAAIGCEEHQTDKHSHAQSKYDHLHTEGTYRVLNSASAFQDGIGLDES